MQFSVLVRVYELLEGTPKRLEKTHYLSEFLRMVEEKDLEQVIRLVQGKVFPDYDPRELGFAAKLLLKALAVATGFPVTQVEAEWVKEKDLGVTAANLISTKKQTTLFSKPLTVQKVFENLRKIAETEGQSSASMKAKLVAELLGSAQPAEAKYIIRIILSELRVGLGEGTMRDAILWAYFGPELTLQYDPAKNEVVVPKENEAFLAGRAKAVQEAYDIANDFYEVAMLAKTDGLMKISLTPGRPIKVMLFQKATSMEDAFKRVGTPAAVEYKYDGFRMQIHKSADGIKLFTRRLEEVTPQFPDVVAAVASHVRGNSFILDAEVVGYDRQSKKYRPFQDISQRIRRKHNIAEIQQRFPVEVDVFDIMYHDGTSLIKKPYDERRQTIERAIRPEQYVIQPSERLVTGDVEEAERFYRQALEAGNEGVILKNLKGVYKPGSRVGYGVKVKPVMETLEVVIVGAEQGEGKRGEWLATFVIAVRDPETSEFLEIGRVGTGLKEKPEEGFSFKEMTALLEQLIVKREGSFVTVQPKIVIEVNYEEIQRSPTYSSGFALRFPRFVKLREERTSEDASTIDDVRALFEQQRGRANVP